MKFLRNLCLLLGAVYLAAGIIGIRAISVNSSETLISHLDAFGRVWALGAAAALVALAYGIHTRVRIVWRAGFIALALNYFYLAVGAVSATYQAARVPSFSNFWLPSVLVVLGGGAVTVLWALWWKRQRSYFF